MENAIHLQIYTAFAEICDKMVSYVEIPIGGAPYGFLPGHAPLMGKVTEGVGTFRSEEGEDYFAISGGVVRVRDNEIVVLARTAELADTIDIARVQASEERARERLRSNSSEMDI